MPCLLSANLLLLLRRCGFFALALLSIQAQAFLLDEEDKKQFVESALELPPFPEKVDLIPFVVGDDPYTQYLIDGKTLSVGNDEVIRYVLVAISSEGARNVSYEGMRCTTGERRFYASGRSDGSWARSRNDKWQDIRKGSRYPIELFVNYFCPIGGTQVRTAVQARDILRRGGAR